MLIIFIYLKDFDDILGVFFSFPPLPPSSKACFLQLYINEEIKICHSFVLTHGKFYFKSANIFNVFFCYCLTCMKSETVAWKFKYFADNRLNILR